MSLIRRNQASSLVLTVMMWGVMSVLMTRVYLRIMNNPTVTFGEWHIAHVLWGGLLMLVAMILVLAFDGNKTRKYGAVVFGVGWGLFIDEIGKFLTKDNDYWFRPAPIFIYISFVGLFLIYRYLERMGAKDRRAEYYAALDNLKEVADGDLEKQQKEKILSRLKRVISTGGRDDLYDLSVGLIKHVSQLKTRNNHEDWSLRIWLKKISHISYNKIIKRKVVVYGLWTYSLYFAVDKIWDIFKISTSDQKMKMIEKYYQDYDLFGKSDIYMIVLKIVFDLIAAIFFLLGAGYFWSRKRNRGIRYFRDGLYVSIFFVSISRFYFEQLGALYELSMSIMLLYMLNRYQREMVVK